MLAGPGFEVAGRAAVVRGLQRVERYQSTFHAVLNQLYEFAGDDARGETYCLASHVFERDGTAHKLDWAIRYQDHCARTATGWRFTRRELVVDWQQELPLSG